MKRIKMAGPALSLTALAAFVLGTTLCACVSCSSPKFEEHGKYNLVRQHGGPILGYSPESGVEILKLEGLAFKDLNRNGALDPFEDWRLDPKERAADLASKLTVEQLCGLMIHSSHQQTLDTVISSDQRDFLLESNVRHVLVTKVASPYQAACWSNDLQATVEAVAPGIPVNCSSDPRNYTEADSEHNAGSGGDISHWPREIGLGATFDMDIIRRHGEIASKEYRALGIVTALSPQVDLNTDPRWRRFNGTFSESPDLNTEIARVYVDAFQTSTGSAEIAGGWGYESVNAMVKHWPGGGAQEGGRDSHFSFGKYSVYPGGNFEMHQRPFTEGAFKLDGPTGCASAVMPFYTISWGIDPSGENVGQNFSKYMITELLREGCGFDGLVCTDWAVTKEYVGPYRHVGSPWGVETLTTEEKHLRIFEAGVDQIGGVNDVKPVIAAYGMYAERYGEAEARERFEQSGRRILLNMFRTGLFENPYLDPERSAAIVGCEEFCRAGYEAQLKSIVMLKNKALPIKERLKVYVPERHFPASRNIWGGYDTERWGYLLDTALVSKYYDVVATPQEADFAIVFIKSPEGNWGYDINKLQYLPISLQYEDYTAVDARAVSIAGGDPFEASNNRSYRGRTEKTYNRDDMVSVIETKKTMGEKPVIVAVLADRAFIPAEIEPSSDAMLVGFGVSNQAIMDIISGAAEPCALLPMQLPANMRTVELQFEDTPYDMECYVDSEGYVYDFAYGLNWSGVISDSRVTRYRR
jgi:Beta-glucosidase-related glycosidases